MVNTPVAQIRRWIGVLPRVSAAASMLRSSSRSRLFRLRDSRTRSPISGWRLRRSHRAEPTPPLAPMTTARKPVGSEASSRSVGVSIEPQRSSRLRVAYSHARGSRASQLKPHASINGRYAAKTNFNSRLPRLKRRLLVATRPKRVKFANLYAVMPRNQKSYGSTGHRYKPRPRLAAPA